MKIFDKTYIFLFTYLFDHISSPFVKGERGVVVITLVDPLSQFKMGYFAKKNGGHRMYEPSVDKMWHQLIVLYFEYPFIFFNVVNVTWFMWLNYMGSTFCF